MRSRFLLTSTLTGTAVLTALSGCSFDSGVFVAPSQSGDADVQPSPDAAQGVDAAVDADIPVEPDAAPAVAGLLRSDKVNAAPNLDGNLEAVWNTAEFKSFKINEGADYYGNSQYGNDAEVRFASLHTATHVYFFVEVKDDELVSDNSSVALDDSIELVLDGDNDRSGPPGYDDQRIVVRFDSTYANLGLGEAKIFGAVETTTIGYNIEIGIELSDLGVTSTDTLGFNLVINDDDAIGGSYPDGYGLWYLPETAACTSCCLAEPRNYPWCDTTRMGQLSLQP